MDIVICVHSWTDVRDGYKAVLQVAQGFCFISRFGIVLHITY